MNWSCNKHHYYSPFQPCPCCVGENRINIRSTRDMPIRDTSQTQLDADRVIELQMNLRIQTAVTKAWKERSFHHRKQKYILLWFLVMQTICWIALAIHKWWVS